MFPYLLEFVAVERDATEYGLSELKSNFEQERINFVDSSPTTKVCLLHSPSYHPTEEFRQDFKGSITIRNSFLMNYSACFSYGNGCDKYHHITLHDTSSAYDNTPKPATNFSDDSTAGLLPLMTIRVDSPNRPHLSVLRDSGASISPITHSKAKSLHLVGRRLELSITKVGGDEETIASRVYNVSLLNIYGQRQLIRAYGIDKITNNISSEQLLQI